MRSLIVALALVPTTLLAQPAPDSEAPPQYGPPAPPPVVVEAPPPAVQPAQPARAACAPTYAAAPVYAPYYPVLQPPPAPQRQRAAIGISLGGFHSKTDAMDGIDASGTYGLFGRLGVSRHLFAQLDISRVDRDDSWKVYATTASLAYAFGSSRLVPILRAGLGYDHASNEFIDSRSGYRAEVGAGLEARFDGGVIIGVDLAAGTRAAEQLYCAYDAPYYFGSCESPVQDGDYRAAKVTLGFAF